MADPWAEEVNYWQTSQSSPDTWMDRAKREIAKAGGKVIADGFGNDALAGRAAYMLGFIIGSDTFKIVWPVLASKAGNERAARIQAATMLYHDIKARCISATVIGPRAAFFSYVVLPGGQTAAQLSTPELARVLPTIVQFQLTSGGVKTSEVSDG